MSAVTIHTPVVELPRRSATVIQFPGARGVPAVPAQRGREHQSGPLRLTRRGRLVITLLVATLVVAGALLGAQTALAGQDAAPASLSQVTVLPGDTLWSIAAESLRSQGSTDVDVRDRVAEIRDLNALESSSLSVGQELVLPSP
jgi:LysM repeat protein